MNTKYEYNFLNKKDNVQAYLEAHGCELLDYWRQGSGLETMIHYNGKDMWVPVHTGGTFRTRRLNCTFEWECYLDGTSTPQLTISRLIREHEFPTNDNEFDKVIRNN